MWREMRCRDRSVSHSTRTYPYADTNVNYQQQLYTENIVKDKLVSWVQRILSVDGELIRSDTGMGFPTVLRCIPNTMRWKSKHSNSPALKGEVLLYGLIYCL